MATQPECRSLLAGRGVMAEPPSPQRGSLKGRKWVAISQGHTDRVTYCLSMKRSSMSQYWAPQAAPGSNPEKVWASGEFTIYASNKGGGIREECCLRGSNEDLRRPPPFQSLKCPNYSIHHSCDKTAIKTRDYLIAPAFILLDKTILSAVHFVRFQRLFWGCEVKISWRLAQVKQQLLLMLALHTC